MRFNISTIIVINVILLLTNTITCQRRVVRYGNGGRRYGGGQGGYYSGPRYNGGHSNNWGRNGYNHNNGGVQTFAFDSNGQPVDVESDGSFHLVSDSGQSFSRGQTPNNGFIVTSSRGNSGTGFISISRDVSDSDNDYSPEITYENSQNRPRFQIIPNDNSYGETSTARTDDKVEETTTKPKRKKKKKKVIKPKPRPTSRPAPQVSESEWKSMERLRNHWANTVHTQSKLAKKFVFFLDKDIDYSRHGACFTPNQQVGHCHYVQLCPLPEVIRSFDKFLTYACFIRNRYVGICCPDSYIELIDEVIDETSLGTTRRPKRRSQNTTQTQRPNRIKSNDGSDYNNGLCGTSQNVRIVGGAAATPKEWVWMAAIILKEDINTNDNETQTKPFCGGVVLSSQYILTAAHCLLDETPDTVTVRLGAYDFSSSADPEAQDFDIDFFKIHPKYNKITKENDLAIIKLESKTEFTKSIQPICLPQRNRDYAGQSATVTGWGHTSLGGRTSNELRQVSLPVWNNTQCDAAYSLAITDTMLCAGNEKGGMDSCKGDSGGPLMLQGPNKKWMVIGVVSWGINCGDPGFPGVYTRISKYIDWIKTNANDL